MVLDDFSRALVIYDDYKHFNKLRKKMMTWNFYKESDYNDGKIKLPSMDRIIIIGLKNEESKWRRILYRKGISISVQYIEKV